jgi:5'-phosphate synthase pdxT subunit
MVKVGVLALQGDFAAHATALRSAAVAAGVPLQLREVRRPGDLEGLAGLVLPGGESTTLLKLLAPEQLDLAIARFVTEQGGALFGTCAGAILVSREVRSPAQRSLGLLDAVIERNAYGRQVDSFITRLSAEEGSGLDGEPLEAVFIRAPRFLEVSPRVGVLARVNGDPALVRQGRVLAATFHPEMTADARVHRFFLEHVIGA